MTVRPSRPALAFNDPAFFDALDEDRVDARSKKLFLFGPERMGLVTAHFYDRVGGPQEPLTFEPAVTCAIAALPGAEIELLSRPSVTAPQLSSVPPPSPSKPADPDPYKD